MTSKNKPNNINKIKPNGNSKILNESMNTEDKEDNLNTNRILFSKVINNKNDFNDINKTISYKYNELELENNMFNQTCISNNEVNANKMYSNDIFKAKHKKNILSYSVPIPISKNDIKKNEKNEKNSKFHIIFGKMIYKNLFQKIYFEKKLLYEYIIISSQMLIFLFQSFFTVCLSLAIARLSSGTSSVIVDPAATNTLSPNLTGATKFVFDPIKHLSPIIVLFLLVPS